jgi:hypothetical protein
MPYDTEYKREYEKWPNGVEIAFECRAFRPLGYGKADDCTSYNQANVSQ